MSKTQFDLLGLRVIAHFVVITLALYVTVSTVFAADPSSYVRPVKPRKMDSSKVEPEKLPADESRSTEPRTAVLHAHDIISKPMVVYNNKIYEFNLRRRDFNAAPLWTNGMENPPLSAMKAMEVAQAALRQFIHDSGEWKIANITLMPLEDYNYWYWNTRFVRNANSDGIVPLFEIPVYFNGSVPNPQIRDINAR